MPKRLIHGTGVLTLTAVLAWFLAGQTDPTLRSADALRGERWYRLVHDGSHVGYLRTRTQRDRLGLWHFDSDLRFVLSRGNPVRVVEHLRFAAAAPYPLLQATQRTAGSGTPTGTAIERQGDSYRMHRAPALDPEEFQRLDMSFSLPDYLGFETWLREFQPAAGASITSRALDFERRQVVARRFTVRGRNATGYQITNPAPLDATFIQLDDRLRPVAMTLSGLFHLEHTTRNKALAPRTALQAASYFVPTDRPLHNHTQIKALTLEVTGAAASELWPTLSTGNTLHRQAGTVSIPRLLGDELRDTAEHPVSDPRVQALARRAAGDADTPDEQIDALTQFVHDYLRYEEDGGRRHVLELLDQPRGDCNEHADLLTTLARSLGIPSRTVFGLAYAEDGQPAFRFHAWNEVLAGDTWRAVDPTWNQPMADATHIPMPGNVAHALELLTGGLSLSFTVRDIEYF